MTIPNSTYTINLHNKKITHNNVDIPPDDDGLYCIVLLNGSKLIKSFEWFKHLTNLNLVFDIKYMKAIKHIIFNKQKPFGVSKDYEYIPTFKLPIYIKNTKYRLIARFPKYGISSTGEVFSLHTNNIIKCEDVNVFIYKRVRIMDDMISRSRIPSVHRLVALTWNHNTDYTKYNVVDHDDGNKLNNDSTNLKWTNNSKNLARAIRRYSGFYVRNVDTNEITRHSTALEVSNYIGRSKIDFARQPIDGYRRFVTSNGTFDVSLVDKKEEVKSISMNTGIREIKNIHTGEVHESTSNTKLIEISGVSKSSIIKYLDLGYDNRELNGWLIRYKSESLWADTLGTMILYKPLKLRVCITDDNLIYDVFESHSKLAKVLSVSCRTISKKLRNGSPILYKNKICKLLSLPW